MFQLSADVKTLLQGVQSVQSVVDKKNTIPVLANLLITPNPANGTAQIAATNLETGKAVTITADSPNEATPITLPAQKLTEILKELPAQETVTLDEDDKSWGVIECGKSRFRIAGLPPTDFPNLPEMPHAFSVTLDGVAVQAALKQVMMARSADPTRQVLTGILWQFDGAGKLHLVATDGHRLHLTAVPCIYTGESVSLIVPAAACTELLRGDVTDLTMRWGEAQVAWQWRQTLMISRVFDGSYPDYKAILSPDGVTATLDRPIFSAALRRVALLSGDSHLLRLTFAADTLRIQAQDPNCGEAYETIPASWTGEPLTIGFNARYLQDACAGMSDETMRLRLCDALRPGVLTEGETLWVIMPMRV